MSVVPQSLASDWSEQEVRPTTGEPPSAATMSVQEATQHSASPLSGKVEAKLRPEIPPKPSTQPSPSPLKDGGSTTSSSHGKVKGIVNKFSKKDEAPQNEQHTNSSTELPVRRQFNRPPTIKPKPARASLPLQLKSEQAPPLPVKRSRTLQKQTGSLVSEEGDAGAEACRSGTLVFTVVFV